MAEQGTSEVAAGGSKKDRADWNDSTIPCGNSPPLSRLPMVLSIVVWIAWIGFLVSMTVLALRSVPA